MASAHRSGWESDQTNRRRPALNKEPHASRRQRYRLPRSGSPDRSDVAKIPNHEAFPHRPRRAGHQTRACAHSAPRRGRLVAPVADVFGALRALLVRAALCSSQRDVCPSGRARTGASRLRQVPTTMHTRRRYTQVSGNRLPRSERARFPGVSLGQPKEELYRPSGSHAVTLRHIFSWARLAAARLDAWCRPS
jgi:hypothetical protein